jgi:hypothetical protein
MSDFRATDPYLQKRYGLKSRQRRWIAPAVIAALIGGGWLIWSSWFHLHNSVTTQVVTYAAISPQKIKVNYTYAVEGKDARYECTFVALDAQSNVVGEINEPLPIGPAHGGASVVITTRAPAASANLDSCFALR